MFTNQNQVPGETTEEVRMAGKKTIDTVKGVGLHYLFFLCRIISLTLPFI